MQFPAVRPGLGPDCVGDHCSPPSGNHSMRLMVSPTTPGEMCRCLGMFAVCFPHGQVHFTCGPRPGLLVHPCSWSARLTSRSFIPVGMLDLAPLDVNGWLSEPSEPTRQLSEPTCPEPT